jgi:mono/diheme cytochrome c family protein
VDLRDPLMMNPARTALVLAAGAMFASAAIAEPRFSAGDIEKGRLQFHRTCSQCHGYNMVNAGTTAYDLRRFPIDDPGRFFNSVTNGKGSMPSFKDALTSEQVQLLWAYVGSHGGKEP